MHISAAANANLARPLIINEPAPDSSGKNMSEARDGIFLTAAFDFYFFCGKLEAQVNPAVHFVKGTDYEKLLFLCVFDISHCGIIAGTTGQSLRE
jgi:hypothetical protein